MRMTMIRRVVVCVATLLVALPLPTSQAWADTPVIVVTGGVTTSDAGGFQVALSLKTESGCESELVYGDFLVDAVGDENGVTPVDLTFCVTYADTRAERDAFAVEIRIDNFQLSPIPLFEGSEAANFQIPNRYLTLTTVGDIAGGSTNPGVGQITHVETDESSSFDGDASLRIASAQAGTGFFEAEQEITLTLAIPAGIHPGTYVSRITLETLPII